MTKAWSVSPDPSLANALDDPHPHSAHEAGLPAARARTPLAAWAPLMVEAVGARGLVVCFELDGQLHVETACGEIPPLAASGSLYLRALQSAHPITAALSAPVPIHDAPPLAPPALHLLALPLPSRVRAIVGLWTTEPLTEPPLASRPSVEALLVIAGGLVDGLRAARRRDVQQMRLRELHARQRQLAMSIDSFPGGLFVTAPDGTVVLSNATWRQAIARVLGDGGDRLRWPDLVRALAYRGFYPDAIGREEEFIAWRLGLISVDPPGHEIRAGEGWVIVRDRVLDDGHVLHLVIDISNRKRSELALTASEAALRRSQERLQAVLQALPDLWLVLDGQGRCLQSPAAPHPLLGAAPWPPSGQRVDTLFPGPTGERLRQALSALASSGEPQRLEAQLAPGEDLSPLSIEIRLSPMPDGHALLLARDLTELNVLRHDVDLLERVLEADVSLPLLLVEAAAPLSRVVYCNPALERLLGVSRTELLGQDWRVLVDEQADNRLRLGTIGQAMAGGHGATVVLEHTHACERLLAEWHMSPVHNDRGEVSHFIFVVRNVTEQSRAAEKLRVSEELYRSVAGAISDGLMVVMLDGRVAAVNPAACRIVGVPQDELLGHHEHWPFTLLDSALEPAPEGAFPAHRVLAHGLPVVDEVHALRRPDGEVRWVSVSCHPLRLTPDETLVSVVVTFRDITETREAARRLRQSEERWNFALEGAGHGVWDWDIQQDRTFFSHQWKSLLGFEDGEIGDHIHEGLGRIHAEDRPRAVEALRRHLAGETELYQAEYRIRRKDGQDIWVLDRGKVVAFGPDDRPARMVGTLSDITQRKAAEQALRDKQAAEMASRAKSQFLSRMSHEMRTPLNAMLGFAQLIKLEPDASDATRADYVEHILQAGQHLLALINDVLDLQRVEEGCLAVDPQPVDLRQVIATCMEMLRPQAETTAVSFACNVPAGLLVLADPRRLRQVLLNIGSNAVKYNRPGGQVRWLLDGVDLKRVRIGIEDDGAGLMPEQIERLFQPFERLGKETSNIEGTGLGLIIARSLVQEMGGTLELSSRPGLGTRVTLEFPRHLAMTPDPSAPRPLEACDSAMPLGLAAVGAISSSGAGARMRLLYVEDNRINALLFEQALAVHSHIELRIAEDGQQALDVVRTWKPDVLVLDAHLPGMSGYEALQALRSVDGLEHTPAYMCSADAMPEDLERASRAGFEGYWTKPIDIAQVLGDLGRLAASLRSRQPGL